MKAVLLGPPGTCLDASKAFGYETLALKKAVSEGGPGSELGRGGSQCPWRAKCVSGSLPTQLSPAIQPSKKIQIEFKEVK
jgi:hypothetical protein